MGQLEDQIERWRIHEEKQAAMGRGKYAPRPSGFGACNSCNEVAGPLVDGLCYRCRKAFEAEKMAKNEPTAADWREANRAWAQMDLENNYDERHDS